MQRKVRVRVIKCDLVDGSGICGQAPSDFPEIAEFLVKQGIDSISLNPDSVMKITLKVLETEKELRIT